MARRCHVTSQPRSGSHVRPARTSAGGGAANTPPGATALTSTHTFCHSVVFSAPPPPHEYSSTTVSSADRPRWGGAPPHGAGVGGHGGAPRSSRSHALQTAGQILDLRSCLLTLTSCWSEPRPTSALLSPPPPRPPTWCTVHAAVDDASVAMTTSGPGFQTFNVESCR